MQPSRNERYERRAKEEEQVNGNAKPEQQDILDLKAHRMEQWNRAHTHWRDVDSYVQREFTLWTADQDRPTLHLARGKAVIDHAADTMLSSDPIPHREPVKPEGENHKERADEVEKAVKVVFDAVGMYEIIPAPVTAKRMLCTYGYAVVEGVMLDNTDKPEEPQRKDYGSGEEYDRAAAVYEWERKAHMPFRVRCPSPDTVLLDPLEKVVREAIRVDKREAWRVAELTERKAAANKKREKRRRIVVDVYRYEQGKKYELVEVVEHWTRWWHSVLVGGALVYQEANVWGYVPYAHAFAGFGQQPTGQDHADPRYLAEGLLDPIMDSLKASDQQASALHAVLLQGAFPPIVTTKEPSEAAQAMKGDVWQGKPGVDYGFLVPAQVPNGLFQLNAMFAKDIEEGTYSLNQAGIREEGVGTVGQQAILSAAAAKKFIVPGRQMNHLFTIMGQNLLRLIDNLDETYTVSGFELGPEVIEHDYNLQVKFEAVDPVLQLQERQIAMQEYQMALLSQEDYWSIARKEDATGIRRRILEDAVRKAVAPLLAAPVAQQMGLAEQYAKATNGAGAGTPGSPSPQANGTQGAPMQDMGLGLAAPGGVPSAMPPLPGTPQGNGQALRELRQPLTPQVFNPNPVVPARRP